ncbi:MAG: phosphoribosylformylglycinamidine cyclo-ligase, partial [bacterium]|nr:phosphoribosylformylglycinamidine cyclo-ligase [bacterium]
NGVTLARKIAEKLPDGYLTKMADGRMFGEALCDKAYIYVRFIEDCLDAGIDIHYCANITGHGWRKLMRAPEPFRYEINNVPKVHPVFDFIAEKGKVSVRDMYADYNMRAGFALFVSPLDAQRIAQLWWKNKYPFSADRVGNVQKSAEKRVFIREHDITFGPEDLQVR